MAASPPPTANKTVLGLTSSSFLIKKPSAKNAGSDKNSEIFPRQILFLFCLC